MRSVAFGDGETLTFIRGQSDWIAVAGMKNERMFYRKAVIACGGRSWHHIAFEYPVELSRIVEPLVNRASSAIDASKDEGCDVAKSNRSSTTGAAPPN